MMTGPFTVERKEFAGHPYIAIVEPTGNNIMNLELDDALDIHRQLGILLCRSDDCPCHEDGYSSAQKNIADWFEPIERR